MLIVTGWIKKQRVPLVSIVVKGVTLIVNVNKPINNLVIYALKWVMVVAIVPKKFVSIVIDPVIIQGIVGRPVGVG